MEDLVTYGFLVFMGFF